jgi:hypothetical protein
MTTMRFTVLMSDVSDNVGWSSAESSLCGLGQFVFCVEGGRLHIWWTKEHRLVVLLV